MAGDANREELACRLHGMRHRRAIEIEFANEARMRIAGAVDPATLTAAVAVLADGRRHGS
jgi:hypothetical protein